MNNLGSIRNQMKRDTDSDDDIILLDDVPRKIKEVPSKPIVAPIVIKKKEIGKASTSAVSKVVSESGSDSDEDFYSNILQRKQKKVAVKKKKAYVEKVVSTDDFLEDLHNSTLDDFDEVELTVEERIKQQVEKQRKQEKEEQERENELIRSRALQQFNEYTSTHVYVNPLMEDTRKELRAIHEIENQMDNSPVAPKKKRRFTIAPTDEKITIIVDDLETPSFKHPTYSIGMKETFEDLRNVLSEKWNADPVCIRLELKANAELIQSTDTPTSLNIAPNEYISVTAMILGKKIERKDPFDLEIKCQIENGHRTKIINVKKYMCFVDIKPIIMDAWKINSIKKLVFDAEEICDGESPESLDMDDGCVIDVYQ